MTARFLNVLALLFGSIALITIQLGGLQVGENFVLELVRVLDQTELRGDELAVRAEAAYSNHCVMGTWPPTGITGASIRRVSLSDIAMARDLICTDPSIRNARPQRA